MALGPLEIARLEAAAAPKWVLFEQPEVNEQKVEESRKRFRQRNAELMRLGKQLLSKEAYEVVPTEEVVVRDGMVKDKKEIGELHTHLHAHKHAHLLMLYALVYPARHPKFMTTKEEIQVERIKEQRLKEERQLAHIRSIQENRRIAEENKRKRDQQREDEKRKKKEEKDESARLKRDERENAKREKDAGRLTGRGRGAKGATQRKRSLAAVEAATRDDTDSKIVKRSEVDDVRTTKDGERCEEEDSEDNEDDDDEDNDSGSSDSEYLPMVSAQVRYNSIGPTIRDNDIDDDNTSKPKRRKTTSFAAKSLAKSSSSISSSSSSSFPPPPPPLQEPLGIDLTNDSPLPNPPSKQTFGDDAEDGETVLDRKFNPNSAQWKSHFYISMKANVDAAAQKRDVAWAAALRDSMTAAVHNQDRVFVANLRDLISTVESETIHYLIAIL